MHSKSESLISVKIHMITFEKRLKGTRKGSNLENIVRFT